MTKFMINNRQTHKKISHVKVSVELTFCCGPGYIARRNMARRKTSPKHAALKRVKAGVNLATLSEITDLDPELLEEKFQLEPRIRHDPNQSANLLFLSPLVLLEDLELREGGFQDRGAKEVLSRVAKHICESRDPSLLQVPGITYFYMGYGKKSENKKCQMAINKEEAKVWMRFLNLSRFTQEKDPEEGTSTSVEKEVPMEIDFPTRRDTQALDIEDSQQTEDHDSEDSIGPNDSGLQIPLKGSYVLLFSILLLFFDKKQKKPAASTDEPSIGANKVSDFLLFWIIPYLLNYNHQKVREIVQHHRQVNGRSFTTTIKMSSLKIIEEAMESCQVSPELKQVIKTKYNDFYGTEQLEYEYDLLATADGEPVILVPKRYKVSKMPAELEDIGSRWRELGDVKLTDEFMSKFIKNKEIQRDFLYNSMPHLAIRQDVDYAILFPDEKTFSEVIGQLENSSCEYLSRPKGLSKGGRNLITPRIGLVRNMERNLSVCFSYFQGTVHVSLVCITMCVYLYILLTKHKGRTGRISALGLDKKKRPRADIRPVRSQAVLVNRRFITQLKLFRIKTQMIDCKDTINLKRAIFI